MKKYSEPLKNADVVGTIATVEEVQRDLHETMIDKSIGTFIVIKVIERLSDTSFKAHTFSIAKSTVQGFRYATHLFAGNVVIISNVQCIPNVTGYVDAEGVEQPHSGVDPLGYAKMTDIVPLPTDFIGWMKNKRLVNLDELRKAAEKTATSPLFTPAKDSTSNAAKSADRIANLVKAMNESEDETAKAEIKAVLISRGWTDEDASKTAKQVKTAK